MRTNLHTITPNRRSRVVVRQASPSNRHRRGSALMIVMVLMGMLALLGVLFYTFAAQERSNASSYSDGAKDTEDPSLTPDAMFDWALEQIIVGTDPRLTNSMLWGSRHSLLSNALGVGYNAPGDLHPFNGEGVNLIYDATGTVTNGSIAVDQDRNGIPDDGTNDPNDYRYLLDYNDSPAAPKQHDSGERQVFNGPLYFPQTDVGYTYPDINNVFLTYVSKVRDQNAGVHRVVKPAFMDPALLRAPISGISAPLTFEDTNLNGLLDIGEDLNGNGYLDDWCLNPTTAARVMRAHPRHIYVPPSGIPSTPTNRYLTNAEAVTLIGPSAYGFPAHPMAATYDTRPTASGGSGAGQVFMPGRMGAYTKLNSNPTLDDPVEFDYDNDGDGFNEAVLMDLDFPAQQDASGNLFVPMFLVTIHDLDALINLNVHGNLAKILLGPNDATQAVTPVSNTSNPYGYSNVALPQFSFVSQSNLGLGPSEVNPLWVLNARYSTDSSAGSTIFNQHQKFYGSLPTLLSGTMPSWGETANMEFTWSKIGRLNFSTSGVVTDLFPGTYGEQNRLYNDYHAGTMAATGGVGLPRPGISLQDDNNDINEGQNDYTPYFQHPLDYTGLGTYLSTATPKQLNWSTTLGPNQWISYTEYENNNSNITAVNNPAINVVWGQRAITNPSPPPPTTYLMTNSITQGLGDDPNEVAFYTPNISIDNIFTPDEMLYLNLSNSEIDRLNINSRLSSLLPFNFAKSTTDNSRGAVIRRKFTTESNDRKSFGLPTSYRAFGTSGIGIPHVLATAAVNSPPGQEYSYDPSTQSFKFPPQFGSGGTLIPRFQTTPLDEDPIRPSTRHLLEIEWNSQQSLSRLQRKLSINQVLTGDLTSALAFRDLTPHPTDPSDPAYTPVYTTIGGLPPGTFPYPPTAPAAEEYWARNDRQKMARDIYTVLYLLAHGDDTINTATTSNTTPPNNIYTDAQLREMAQFAVNLVYSMDRDNIITRFEYDKDLSDGWNLDDDPYGTLESPAYATSNLNYNPSYPNDGLKRGEVYGVERLDLSISESLVIQANKSAAGTNYPQTNYDESVNNRFFFFTELRNQSPNSITFDPKEAWQVVLRQEAGNGVLAAWETRLSLKNGAVLDTNNTAASTNPYVIGTTDAGTAVNAFSKSTFAIDPTWATIPTVRIAPNKSATATVLDCDLDLVQTTTGYNIESCTTLPSSIDPNTSGTDVTSTPGAMLAPFTGVSPLANMTAAGATLKVILRRRAHPTRTMTTSSGADNPWVEIDSMMLQATAGGGFCVFSDPTSSPAAGVVTAALKTLTSRERPQPLDGNGEGASTGTGVPATGTTVNTLGQINSLTTSLGMTPFTYWQLHFDRNYASLMDLLYVPVFGPHQLTTLGQTAFKDSPDIQVNNPVSSLNWKTGSPLSTPYSIVAKTAAAKFMIPEDPSNVTATTIGAIVAKKNNRWHRLLEFLEVPTRTNVNLAGATALTIPRVPGKLNLNMLRHGENLAALLDDSRLVTLNLNSALPTPDADAPSLDDNFPPEVRDWWQQFLWSRDPFDPSVAVNQSLYVPLPGLPSAKTVPLGAGYLPDARPFRDIADVGYSTNVLYPGVPHASVADTLFRPLPVDTFPTPAASKRQLFEVGTAAEHSGGSIDPYIRNRLLSKIAGSTTTRSNCFAIFVSVKYFQAVQQNGAVRIGGPLSGTPAPEQRGFFIVDRSKLENGQTSQGPTYDFRAFIDYRTTLQSQ